MPAVLVTGSTAPRRTRRFFPSGGQDHRQYGLIHSVEKTKKEHKKSVHVDKQERWLSPTKRASAAKKDSINLTRNCRRAEMDTLHKH